jgi:hypothetical protein
MKILERRLSALERNRVVPSGMRLEFGMAYPG